MNLLKSLLLAVFLAAPSYAIILPMDVIILFDDSGSIDPGDFETQKTGIQTIIDGLPVNASEVNVSLYSFSTNASLVLNLSSSTGAITTALNNAFQNSGQTNHAEAFTSASTEFSNNGRSGATGIVLLITDGVANKPDGGGALIDAISAADTLKSNNYLIYGIGIGGSVASSDLENYASSPTGDFIFTYGDFDAFEAGAGSISTDILTHSTSAVPEPSAFALLLGAGALGVVVLRRRGRASE